MTDNLYWLWLSMNCHAKTASLLLEHFSHPHDIYKANERKFRRVLGDKHEKELSALLNKDLSAAHAMMDTCFLNGIGVLPYDSPEYPPLLRQIAAPPTVLYYRGHLLNLARELCVSVVGTRDMTEYGERAAFDIARDVSIAGGIIVSGLALGIDGVANAAALSAGGKTVAVLGSGVDRIYPAEHKTLYHQILQNGMVISEYPPGTPPARHRFPERNRIISGMSQATLLVEGPEKSGAMITARLAMEQGRRVFAVPGNIDEPNSFSSNYLIRNGAKAVTSAEDILDAFLKTHANQIHPEKLLVQHTINRKSVLGSYGVVARGAGKKPVKLSMPETENLFAPDSFLKEEPSAISMMPLVSKMNTAPAAPLRVAASPLSPDASSSFTETPSPLHKHSMQKDASSVLSIEVRTEGMDPSSKAVFLALENGPLNPDEIAGKAALPIAKVMSILMILEIEGQIELIAGNRYKISQKK